MKFKNILMEYEMLGKKAQEIESRRNEIRAMVTEKGGEFRTATHIGIMKPQSRRQMAGVKEFETSGLMPTIEKLGLVRTIEYQMLIVSPRRKQAA